MSTNKELARREFDEIWNQRNLEVIDEIFSKDVEGCYPGNPSFGLDAYKQWVINAQKAWPDLHFDIDDVIEEENKVAIPWTLRGTHEGEFVGIPPTGKKVELTGVALYWITGGKISKLRGHWDNYDMMQQLGVVPSPEE
jgi:steroid delta-isomerase-like uncharacterized protein